MSIWEVLFVSFFVFILRDCASSFSGFTDLTFEGFKL